MSILTLTVERSASPWRDYTGSAEEEQAGYHIAATDRLAGMTVPPSLAQYTYRGLPLLAIDGAQRRVVVNAAVFGDLERPDATQLAPGDSAPIGIVRDPGAFTDLAALAEFLLRAQIVRTYAHLQAELCRVSQQDHAEFYRADFTGVHEYFTNERHRINFGFALVIDRRSGEMRVIGAPAPRAALDVDAIHLLRNGQLSTLWVAIRHLDLDTASDDDAWMVVDHYRKTFDTVFLLVRIFPDWARDLQGGSLLLCEDVGAELANGLAPQASALTVDNLGDGTLYVGDWTGRRALSNDAAAKCLREALHWCSEPYDDLLPEFAERVCAQLKKLG